MTDLDVVDKLFGKLDRHLKRLERYRTISYDDFSKDEDVQDIILYNLQMAIQICIDVASHIVSDDKLGAPDTMADLFIILSRNQILPHDFGKTLAKMVGFRKKLIHEYIEIDLDKVHVMLKENLSDFDRFRGLVYQAFKISPQ